MERSETNLEVAKLCKLLATFIEATQIWLGLVVNNLVGADVSTLCESLPTDLALVWPFPCVTPFMSL